MVALLAATACGDGKASATEPVPTPTTPTVTVNGATVTVSLAATRASREQGLMGVTTLGANSGMLFAFADDRQRFFWMQNTPIPLSIAFIDVNKKIVMLEDMAANTTTAHGGPMMRYALEVNQGWFASHGVTTGMTVAFTLPAGLVIEADP